MQHVIQTGKRAFSAAVAAATIAFSVGAGALMAPTSASAASAGDLIRGTSLSTVYFYGYDGMRYAFPNEKTFMTWFADFSSVKTISDSALSDIGLGGNVVVRPGTTWIKITSVDKVYAVSTDGMIHWIESEEVATDLAGSNWNTNIVDVPDVFFADYTVGSSLMEAAAFDGALYSSGGKTYLAWDGEMREVSAAGMSGNNLMSKYVLDGGNIDDSGLDAGAMITSSIAAVVDASQTWSGSDDEVDVGGDLTVSLASSTPAGATVPQGATSLEVLSFNVRAGAEDAALDQVVFSLTGVGSTSTITNAYLYEGANRLTDARTVNSATRAVTFGSLNLDVDAGETRTLTVRVDVYDSSTVNGNTFGFRIASSADVEGSGDFSGSFPISSNTFTVGGSSVGTVTIEETGSISNPTLGQQDAEIAKFKITAGDEAVDLEQLTLDVDDAADHDDFRLYQNNDLVAYGEWVGNDSVLFDLSSDPYFLDEGENDIFTVSADIGGENDDNIGIALENAADLVAVGRDYGFGQGVTFSSYNDTGSACAATSDQCSFSTIQGGDVTFAFNGPVSGNIETDAQEQELLAFSITSANEITVQNFDVIVYGDDDDGDALDAQDDTTDNDDDGLIQGSGTNVANITDIKIINTDTGRVVMGPMELDGVEDSDDDADQTITFVDDFVVEAGETLNLAVVVDVDDGVTSGTEFAAAVDISDSTLDIEDAQGDALTIASGDIVPGTDITGYNQEASAPSLSIALASTPGDITTIQGASNVHVQSFNMTVGEAGDVVVSSLDLDVYADDDDDDSDGAYNDETDFAAGGDADGTAEPETMILSCSLYDGSELIAGPTSLSSNGSTIQFDDMSWTIEGDSVVRMDVKCNFANVSYTAAAGFAFTLDNDDVTADDLGGDSVTVTGNDINGTTTPTNVVLLNDTGSLAATASASQPAAGILLANSTGNEVASYRFTATNEPWTVDILTFSEEQAEDDSDTVANDDSQAASDDDDTYANNISTATVSYPKADGTTGTKTVSISGNEARFTGLAFYIPVGSPKEVTVSVAIPGTDRDGGTGATSNEKIRMGLFVDATGDDNFHALGAASGSVEDDDNESAIGDDRYATDGIPTFIIRETQPTLVLASGSPDGISSIGMKEALRFNISAASNEDVVLDHIIFSMSSTDNAGTAWNAYDPDAGLTGEDLQGSDFTLYNLTQDGTDISLDNDSSAAHDATLFDDDDSPWTLLGSTGAVVAQDAVVSYAALDLTTEEIIPAGQTNTFALYFNSTGASSADNDSVQFSIANDPFATYLAVSNASNESDVAVTDTTIDVDSGAAFFLGDVIVFDTDDDAAYDAGSEEIMLVTGISSNTLTVVRGYLGTNVQPADANDLETDYDYTDSDDILRMPSTFLWQDDGTTSVSTSYQEYWGSYLVDGLSLDGGTLTF